MCSCRELSQVSQCVRVITQHQPALHAHCQLPGSVMCLCYKQQVAQSSACTDII